RFTSLLLATLTSLRLLSLQDGRSHSSPQKEVIHDNFQFPMFTWGISYTVYRLRTPPPNRGTPKTGKRGTDTPSQTERCVSISKVIGKIGQCICIILDQE